MLTLMEHVRNIRNLTTMSYIQNLIKACVPIRNHTPAACVPIRNHTPPFFYVSHIRNLTPHRHTSQRPNPPPTLRLWDSWGLLYFHHLHPTLGLRHRSAATLRGLTRACALLRRRHGLKLRSPRHESAVWLSCVVPSVPRGIVEASECHYDITSAVPA